jgi:hypothetical protein
MSHTDIVEAIKSECGKINLNFSNDGDGRITSAVKEREYLNLLEIGLKSRGFTFEHQPVERWWWDFRVNGIPFNLKLTTGGTDNAFNKVAIIYTISGQEVEKRNMNYNQFFTVIKDCPKKSERDPMTEYHYLVVNKETGAVLLKSILDIHTYKSNPCNDLQINWTNEFKNSEFVTQSFKAKIQEFLKTVQTSVRQAMASMKEFADAEDFPM